MRAAVTRGHGARALTAASIGIAAILALGPVAAGAATVSGAWAAKVGSAGANGKATISAYTTGTGAIALKLVKLRASTLLPVVIHKGTCSSVGAILVTLPSIRTSSAGAAARTSSLTAPQVTKIAAATKTGKIAIRIGTGTARKCGLFAPLAVPPYVAKVITVGDSPSGVAIAPNGVWVTNFLDLSLSRIDPATNTVLQTIAIGTVTPIGPAVEGTAPEAIAYGEGSLWVSLIGFRFDPSATPSYQINAGSVVRLDPATGNVQATIPVGRGAFSIKVASGAVWVPLSEDGAIIRIDPVTNGIVATIPVPEPIGVAVGPDVVWVACACGTLSRIDPATNTVVTSINTQTTGGDVVIGAGSVWMTHRGYIGDPNGTVTRVDPATNTVVANILVGDDPRSIAFAGGSLWVGLNGEPAVVQIAGPSYSTARKIPVSAPVYSIAATDRVVWAVHETTDKVSRIQY